MEADHEEEILIMKKEIEKERLSRQQNRNPGGLEFIFQENNFDSRKCGEQTSLSKKRKKLESSWQRVIESDMNLRTATAIQKDNSKSYQCSSSTLGPSSLPTDSVMNDQIEVRKLEELRRYIQEDCDQLVLRKERLENEIARLPFKMNKNCMTCLLFSDGKIGQSDYEGSKDQSYNVGPQAPPGVSSSSTAFQVNDFQHWKSE